MKVDLERQPQLEDLTKNELVEYIRKLHPVDNSISIASLIYQRLLHRARELSQQARYRLKNRIVSDSEWRAYLDLADQADAAGDFAEAFFCRGCRRHDVPQDETEGSDASC